MQGVIPGIWGVRGGAPVRHEVRLVDGARGSRDTLPLSRGATPWFRRGRTVLRGHMASMTRHQLRAARTLLVLQQEVLAKEAEVGITALRRFENGNDIAQGALEALQRVVEAQGVILIAPGTEVGGVTTGEGVVLKAQLPGDTQARLDAFKLTSDQAAASLSPERRGSTGRRARVPLPPGLRKKREAVEQDDPKKPRD